MSVYAVINPITFCSYDFFNGTDWVKVRLIKIFHWWVRTLYMPGDGPSVAQLVVFCSSDFMLVISV